MHIYSSDFVFASELNYSHTSVICPANKAYMLGLFFHLCSEMYEGQLLEIVSINNFSEVSPPLGDVFC